MSIYIYNSLTRRKEEFIPINGKNVNIYTCGVTVYDECHIGHCRSLFIFDLIRRYLKYKGYKVKFVRNITDIDDKIINKAREENVSWKDISERYIKRYYEDLTSLGIERADFEPRATEHIPQMIKIIEKLIEKGFAYRVNNDVYFRVRKFLNYGRLSRQRLEDILSGARIEPGEFKEDPLDFCLWKGSKENEPFWNSPFGVGRPGWHIECSAMAIFYLGETLDIHGGGMDLIFPHHENEIAQSESYTGRLFSKYWLHHGLLTINGEKMAKSLNNFVSVQDVLKKYPVDVLKLFFLSSHYRSHIDFSFSKLESSKNSLERILIALNKINTAITNQQITKAYKFKELDEIKDKFLNAMDDDFNTPLALSYIFEVVNIVNKKIKDKDIDFISQARELLLELASILGLTLKVEVDRPGISQEEIIMLIKKRDIARKMKDFELADRIRKDLEEKGIILEDEKDRTVWRRKI